MWLYVVNQRQMHIN